MSIAFFYLMIADVGASPMEIVEWSLSYVA